MPATEFPRITIHDDEELGCALLGRTWICRWWSYPRTQMGRGPQLVDDCLTEATTKHFPDQKIGVVVVLDAHSELPEGSDRTTMMQVTQKHDPNFACSAYVLQGSGFRLAAVRAMISGLLLVMRQKIPTAIFSNPEEAGRWVAQYVDADPDALEKAVAAYCNRADAG